MNRLLRHFIIGIATFVASTAMADVTFFELRDFGGRQLRLDRSMQNFAGTDFNDRAQSAIVEGDSWELCVNPNFGGGCTVLAPGRYPSLGALSGRVTSARPVGTTPVAWVPAGGSITFFESENFGGRQIAADRSLPNSRDVDFNDRARSAIIEGGPWEVCVGTNFGGDCTVFPVGRYPTLGEWSRKISSARPAGGGQATGMPAGGITFFESENFGGRQISADQSMPNLRALDFNDRARSAVIDGRPWQVCVGTNFGGDCTVFPAGRYPTLGEWSKKISSARPASPTDVPMPVPAFALRPPGGIIFFESENFGGRQFMIDQPDPYFGRSHASERQQSAIVEGGAWEICADSDFRGNCRIFVPGRYPELGSLSGHISSVRPSYDRRGEMQRDGMRGRASATLFSGPNLTGRAFALGGDGAGNLDGMFNDRASSLRVDRGYWIFCSDANMRGECRTFGPGEYPVLPRELDNRISSGRRISNEYPYTDSPNWR